MSESAFWRFSLHFYALPGVGAACIELQDRCGVDVNVLLYLLFLAAQARAIGRDDVARIEAEVRAWRDEVVTPLRTVRRALKNTVGSFDPDPVQSLRTEVKRIELEAERIQQETLERVIPASALGVSAPSRAGAVRANLAAYRAHWGGLPDDLLVPLFQAFDATPDTPR